MSEVHVSRVELRGMVTLKADLTDPMLRAAVPDVTGCAMPETRCITRNAACAVAWMAPDELLVMLPHAEVIACVERLEAALGEVHHLVVDVSDARAVFRLEGQGVREVLAKGAPVDLAPAAFPLDSIRRTRLGQVAAALWMCDAQTAELVCFRSVAEYVEAFLQTAAQKDSLPEYF